MKLSYCVIKYLEVNKIINFDFEECYNSVNIMNLKLTLLSHALQYPFANLVF